MVEEIKYSNDSVLNEEIRKAIHEQMAIGYAEMGDLNSELANEASHLHLEADTLINNLLKGDN